MRLVQIAPEVDPLAGGIAASARAVAGELRRRHGFDSEFVSAAELRRSVADRAPAPGARIVLHYAGYGYARRGCPGWLVRAVTGWRRRGEVDLLLTVFHELYASGPPWTSAFWLGPAQRHLARRLARASDGLVTSLGLYAGILAAWTGRADVLTLPIPSTVGEPADPPAADLRPPTLVVFGTAGTRRRAWEDRRRELEATCRSLGVSRVVDVGPPGAGAPATCAGVPVTATGRLPATEVGRLLLESRAGFLAYPPDMLEKSSVFAALSAHGVATICAWAEPRHGALERGRHFLDPALLAAGLDSALVRDVAGEAHAWYRTHTAARQADLLARRLEP